MRRYLLPGLLFATAAVILLVLVPATQRERDAAREHYEVARAEREQLRVRLADRSQRASEDQRPTAVDGAAAVRALRQAVLTATEGLQVQGVEITTSAPSRGAVAAQGRLAAEGAFVEVLRLSRRLASSSSGVLLGEVSLGEARGGVRLRAEAFILKSEPALGPAVSAKDNPRERVLGGSEPALGPAVSAKDNPRERVLGGEVP